MSEIQEEILEGITITENAAERLLQVRTDEDGDYLRASVSGGFQFVNPNASRTCGCGTSFSV